MKYTQPECRFQRGDIVVVNGDIFKGVGMVESIAWFTCKEELPQGELSYKWKLDESFPQVRIDLPSEAGVRDSQVGVHMNGDDLVAGKVRHADHMESTRFIREFANFMIPEKESSFVPICSHDIVDDGCSFGRHDEPHDAMKERSVLIEFEGFVVDLFLCDNGNLGITVEKAPAVDGQPCRDIFVDRETLEVHSV